MYSSMTLSLYMYLYYNFLTLAVTTSSFVQPSCRLLYHLTQLLTRNCGRLYSLCIILHQKNLEAFTLTASSLRFHTYYSLMLYFIKITCLNKTSCSSFHHLKSTSYLLIFLKFLNHCSKVIVINIS